MIQFAYIFTIFFPHHLFKSLAVLRLFSFILKNIFTNVCNGGGLLIKLSLFLFTCFNLVFFVNFF